jgi:ABC-2 type transport system permease protein
MLDWIRSEHLKYKRSFARRLVLLAPLFFLLIAIPQRWLIAPGAIKPWTLLLGQVYNWWPLLFMPLGTALMAALVELQEKKAGRYRNLRMHPVPPAGIWIAKVAVLAYYALMSTLVLMGAVLASGLLTAAGAIPWSSIVSGGLVIWLAALGTIPIQLWAAAWKGTLFSLLVGFLGMVAGVAAAPLPYWVFVPWSWPLRLMAPVIGVHPNGVLLDAADPLRDAAVIPVGIGLSLATVIVMTLLTSVWFGRREVR